MLFMIFLGYFIYKSWVNPSLPSNMPRKRHHSLPIVRQRKKKTAADQCRHKTRNDLNVSPLGNTHTHTHTHTHPILKGVWLSSPQKWCCLLWRLYESLAGSLSARLPVCSSSAAAVDCSCRNSRSEIYIFWSFSVLKTRNSVISRNCRGLGCVFWSAGIFSFSF